MNLIGLNKLEFTGKMNWIPALFPSLIGFLAFKFILINL